MVDPPPDGHRLLLRTNYQRIAVLKLKQRQYAAQQKIIKIESLYDPSIAAQAHIQVTALTRLYPAGAIQENQRREEIVKRCMAGRGYKVIG